jgi:hypothetical protein
MIVEAPITPSNARVSAKRKLTSLGDLSPTARSFKFAADFEMGLMAYVWRLIEERTKLLFSRGPGRRPFESIDCVGYGARETRTVGATVRDWVP